MPIMFECFNCLYSDDVDESCSICIGEGNIKLDKELVGLNQFLNDQLHSHVSLVFSDYCKIFKIPKVYGVERFVIGQNTLNIVQDISARSCYNTINRELPIEYFYADHVERINLMQADYDKTQIGKIQQDKENEINRLKNEAARLLREAEKLKNE